MQRERSLFLVGVLGLIVAACGGGAAPSGPGASQGGPASQPASEAPAETEPTVPSAPASVDPGDPTLHQAPELEALLPNDLGGEQAFKFSARGDAALENISDAISDLMTERGKLPEQFSLATAADSNTGNPDWIAFVMRIEGVEGSAIVAAITGSNPAFPSEEVSLGGKTVTKLGPNGEGGWYYASGEIAFSILAEPAIAEEFVSKLP